MFFLATVMYMPVVALAVNAHTPAYYKIKEITPYSNEHAGDANVAGAVHLKMLYPMFWEDRAIGNAYSGCSIGSVFIRGEDKYLIAVAMQVFAMDKGVRVFSYGDAFPGSNACILRAIKIQ